MNDRTLEIAIILQSALLQDTDAMLSDCDVSKARLRGMRMAF